MSSSISFRGFESVPVTTMVKAVERSFFFLRSGFVVGIGYLHPQLLQGIEGTEVFLLIEEARNGFSQLLAHLLDLHDAFGLTW